MKKPEIAIIGAGPGGLVCATLLRAQGYDVTVIEKQARVGGRSQRLSLGNYDFDTGPTFFTLPQQFAHLMQWAKVDYHTKLHFQRLDPLYTLTWPEAQSFSPRATPAAMTAAIAQRFPTHLSAYQKFEQQEHKKFQAGWAALSQPFTTPLPYLQPQLLASALHLQLHQSLATLLTKKIGEPYFEQALGFQAKYLGMDARQCPALFSMLSYLERTFGLYHLTGGLSSINEFLFTHGCEQGIKFLLATEVREICYSEQKITSLKLHDGFHLHADAYVLNADFAQTIQLLPERARNGYTNKQLAKKKYSQSTINWYFGLDCELPLEHHHFCLPSHTANAAPLLYLHNPSRIDPTLAPSGHSSLYALMPVENQLNHCYTSAEIASLTSEVIATISAEVGFDIRPHIIVQHQITPQTWQTHYDVFGGAVFNLAHTFDQLLYFRPHNQFLANLFLVGGGTHPGSGLPTIYESARITSNLIFKKFADTAFIPKLEITQEEQR